MYLLHNVVMPLYLIRILFFLLLNTDRPKTLHLFNFFMFDLPINIFGNYKFSTLVVQSA
jgi:hypothetical protein